VSRDGASDPGDRIAKWATDAGWTWIPGREPTGNARLRVFVVDSDDTVQGVVTVVPLPGEPGPSYFVETCRGSRILEESWGDGESLGALLDDALRLLRGRKRPEETAAWRLAAEP
jgi:hypothetical protein